MSTYQLKQNLVGQKQFYDVVIVGGGAAGFFAAVQIAESRSSLKIVILEKSNKLLSKVRISGGGRCNVTHHCFNPTELARHYPRGASKLKTAFRSFHAGDMVRWLSDHGVAVVAEADGRMFPKANTSQAIIDCFVKSALERSVQIEMNAGVESVERTDFGYEVITQGGKLYAGRKVLVAIGGNPNPAFYSWIEHLGHTIRHPIPSLFTFNDPARQYADLMGLSVSDATVRIGGTKVSTRGPVLITHWGLSGPAVIRLSAWAAEYLHSVGYDYTVFVNWTGDLSEEALRALLLERSKTHPKQKVWSHPIVDIPIRLWVRFCENTEISPDKLWGELSKKSMNKLLEQLIRTSFRMKGKTTFKEEFVTCGGIALEEINFDTMESRKMPGIHFAGEVLNIDGETGGFNFQAAWTTAYIAARAIVNESGSELAATGQ